MIKGELSAFHPAHLLAKVSDGAIEEVDELERRDASTAFITMCCGSSVGTGTIIERL